MAEPTHCNECGQRLPCRGCAERDAARMDWLEKHGGSLHIDYYLRDGKRVYILRDNAWGRSLGYGPTIRAAIDFARTPGVKADASAQRLTHCVHCKRMVDGPCVTHHESLECRTPAGVKQIKEILNV